VQRYAMPYPPLELTKAPTETDWYEIPLGRYLQSVPHYPSHGYLRTGRRRVTKVVAQARIHASPPNDYSPDLPLTPWRYATHELGAQKAASQCQTGSIGFAFQIRRVVTT
jgi:hypothetical protein